jgi:glutaryl-CoA dehydrogenase (non-decarboxylating)
MAGVIPCSTVVSTPGACMNFDFSDEHLLLEQTVREWAGRAVAPRIAELDRAHRFDPDILPQMADLGLLGICVPPSWGGAGMDYLSLGLASEELEYVDTSLRVILSVHVGLNSLSLLAWGTEAQKQQYLVPQAAGERIATFGLTEPAAGSDARGIQSVAIRDGDHYRLSGEKMWISLADVADHFLVVAWTDLEKKKARDVSGLSAFIVERSFDGFSSGTLTHKWGILAGNTGFFKMDEVPVPAGNLLGREGEGFKIAMFALDQGRYTVAAGATGLIRACRDASVAYARERKTFGVEIGQHQLVKEMIARMESDYQTSRLLWMRSGWLKNIGRRNTRETSLAKWVATVASERAAGDAVQIHGANGYSDEYPVGRYYRNCKGAVIYEGTREIHTLMQADYLLGYRTDRPTRCELPAWETQRRGPGS